MNIKKNGYTFYASPRSIARELIEIKGWDIDPEVVTQLAPQTGEVWINFLANSKLENIGASINDFKGAFEYLEQKAEAVRKTISFWDAYQIRGVISDQDTLTSAISQLPPNSSLIANINGQWGTENFYQGDIFVKDYYNNIYHIPVVSTGYYYPKKITRSSGNSSTYSITYYYSSNAPAGGSSGTKPVGQAFNEPYTTMEFTGISNGDEAGYNDTYEIASGASQIIELKTGTSTAHIAPIVKAYNSLNEQVFNGLSITSANDGLIIANITSETLTVTVR